MAKYQLKMFIFLLLYDDDFYGHTSDDGASSVVPSAPDKPEGARHLKHPTTHDEANKMHHQ